MGRQPLYGAASILENKTTATTGLATVRDFEPLYQSFEHGNLLATLRTPDIIYIYIYHTWKKKS